MRQNSDISTSAAAAEAGETPRERNARGQGDRLRTEILDAVNRLFTDDARVRPLSLSMREVAREAGITAPAIYRHFENKDELARAAVVEGFALLAGAMDDADRKAAELSPAERLAAQAHAYCRFADEQRGYFRLMFRMNASGSAGEEDGPGAGSGPGVGVAERWRAAVERLRDHQEIRLTQTPEQAAMSLWSSVHGRLVLVPTMGRIWDLGDVHEFVDTLVASVASAPS